MSSEFILLQGGTWWEIKVTTVISADIPAGETIINGYLEGKPEGN